MFGEFMGLASVAAAITPNAGKDPQTALRLLELGRDVISGLILEIRTDISNLKEKYPELAEKFGNLRNVLDSPPGEPDHPLPSENRSYQVNRHIEAEKQFKAVIEDIRDIPESQSFLAPTTASDFMEAVKSGPIVVINTSHYRCDAFVIEHKQIRVLNLPDLSLDNIEERLQCLRSA
jgi:hypothetical protein